MTVAEKIWQQHSVAELGDATTLLHIDRLMLHERSGGRMLKGVLDAGRTVYDPSMVVGTLDHIIDTTPGRGDRTLFAGGAEFIKTFRDSAALAEVQVFDIGDARQGIVHVMAPELGIVSPGMTLVCGDSHTPTVGGVGALAWGIGVTQGEHVLSTQCLAVRRPGQMRVCFEGRLAPFVTAKDMVLWLIGRYGANGGKGRVVEMVGPVIRSLSVEGRMTLCNMMVEFGAWTAIVPPDDVTIEYMAGRPYRPTGTCWDSAEIYWRNLASDDDAKFESEIVVDCEDIEPQVSWGTSTEHVMGITGQVPDPAQAGSDIARASMEKALKYADLRPGDPLLGLGIEAAFIGSCTNSRIEDLRLAAGILTGRKVAPGLKAICVPGSTQVKHQAESEGLDDVFKAAGFEWREAGCSLCFFAGGDSFGAAKRVITTTNRNFENRQGPNVRSHLASPVTVAASAVRGAIADPRALGFNL
ncbi:3-isopropylmalate dehydratase [Methylovirgula ligni]|nr:3-isopropylmalate dehydratase large subunit [Methylovirgula ligni]QAY95506.1 3-isopropylmalate dehydratase [Methylovirgula ligni]